MLAFIPLFADRPNHLHSSWTHSICNYLPDGCYDTLPNDSDVEHGPATFHCTYYCSDLWGTGNWQGLIVYTSQKYT